MTHKNSWRLAAVALLLLCSLPACGTENTADRGAKDSSDSEHGAEDATDDGAGAREAMGDDADERALAGNREKWAQSEPEQYVVQVCTLGIEPPGCVRYAIDGDEIAAAEERIFHPSVPWWEAIESEEKPLDRAFRNVAAGSVKDCLVDSVQYDPELGYITRYTTDCMEHGITGGSWVACFELDTLDLSACEVTP